MSSTIVSKARQHLLFDRTRRLILDWQSLSRTVKKVEIATDLSSLLIQRPQALLQTTSTPGGEVNSTRHPIFDHLFPLLVGKQIAFSAQLTNPPLIRNHHQSIHSLRVALTPGVLQGLVALRSPCFQ